MSNTHAAGGPFYWAWGPWIDHGLDGVKDLMREKGHIDHDAPLLGPLVAGRYLYFFPLEGRLVFVFEKHQN